MQRREWPYLGAILIAATLLGLAAVASRTTSGAGASVDVGAAPPASYRAGPADPSGGCAPLVYTSTDVPQAIPDNNLQGITSTLVISNAPNTIGRVEVTNIVISHEHASDLRAYLTSPEGTRVELWLNVCQGGGNSWNVNNTGFTLSDLAPTVIGSTCPPGQGTYRPTGLLGPLTGDVPNGTWSLNVIDSGPFDVGTLYGWGLRLTTVACVGTPTPSPTAVPSQTPTTAPTNTLTAVPTSTATTAPTDTATAVPTSTATTAPTDTATATATTAASVTQTPFSSPTVTTGPTNTLTPGSSPTSTATAGATDTVPPTSSRTSTPGNSPTQTPGTGSVTPIPSHTPTATGTATPCTLAFNDVPPGSTFYPWIRCLVCRGIVGGYPCGGPGEPCPGSYYRPNNNVTRGQVSKIVAESAGFSDPVPSAQQTFEDVPPGSTFWLWIERLSTRGIIQGYPCGGPFEPCIGPDNRPYFRPNNNVTRGQLSKIVSGSAGYSETPTGQTFEDVPPGSTFYLFIERIAARGIVGGYPCGGPFEPCIGPANRPYFRPFNNATRGQMAKIAAEAFFPNCQTPAAARR
jgi:subtilisin-like proprotein convertase family protein